MAKEITNLNCKITYKISHGWIQSNLVITNFMVNLKLFLTPNVPYLYEVIWQLFTGNGFLKPISSLSNRSLSPSLTVLSAKSWQMGNLCGFWKIREIRKSIYYLAVGREKFCRANPYLPKMCFFKCHCLVKLWSQIEHLYFLIPWA